MFSASENSKYFDYESSEFNFTQSLDCRLHRLTFWLSPSILSSIHLASTIYWLLGKTVFSFPFLWPQPSLTLPFLLKTQSQLDAILLVLWFYFGGQQGTSCPLRLSLTGSYLSLCLDTSAAPPVVATDAAEWSGVRRSLPCFISLFSIIKWVTSYSQKAHQLKQWKTLDSDKRSETLWINSFTFHLKRKTNGRNGKEERSCAVAAH